MAKKETSQKKQSEDTLEIINLSVDGLRKVKACELTFNEEGLTQIISTDNEMGKTTLGIDAVQILIRGNKFANKDIVTHGKSKATLVGQVGPYKITRVIPRDGTPTLKVVDTRTGQPMTGRVQDFLDTFINELTFDPKPFLDKNKNEKLKFMMDLCKLDFSKIDAEINSLYEKRKSVGQEIDKFGEIIVPKKVSRVNTTDILEEKKKIQEENKKLSEGYEKEKQNALAEIEAFNKEQREQAKAIEVEENNYHRIMDDANLQLKEIERLKKELREAENRLETIHKNAEDCEKSLKHLRQNPPLPEKPLIADIPEPEYKPIEALDKQLASAAEINQKAYEYENAAKQLKEKERKQLEYDDFSDQIKTYRQQKLRMLSEAETRVEGLQITEDDILFNGISSDNWSDAQGLSISRKLCISQKPKLSAVFLDRAESMSKKTLQEFVEWAKSEGIQTIITKIVDEKPQTKEDNVYFIYDGTLVDVEEEE